MTGGAVRHFLGLSDAGGDAIAAMLNDAQDRKTTRAGWPKGRADEDGPLDGHILAMVFEKSSTRTRVSFDTAIRQLGGTATVLDAGTTHLGRGETVADTARVLSRMADAVMLRTDAHDKLTELADHASVPVINGLTDRTHPCQIVADLLTIVEHGKALSGLQVCWLGDCNNVLNSVIEAAGLMKFDVRIGTPEGGAPDDAITAAARNGGAKVTLHHDGLAAADGADVVMTDTWVSMGQAHDADKIEALMPFQVHDVTMEAAADDALFLHCLPAHRGEEVMPGVIDGPQSAVWDQAENRVHAQKSILRWAFGQL